MGCFLACFGSSKDAKRRKQRRKVLPRDQRSTSTKAEQPVVSLVQDYSKAVVSPSSEVQDRPEEGPSFSHKQKVTFDNNVKTYEPPILPDVAANFPQEKGDESGKRAETPVQSDQLKSSSEDRAVTSTGSFLPNHRYQNCRDSDDEDEELDYGGSDLSDKDDEEEDDDSDLGKDYNEEFGNGLEEDGIVCSRARIAASQVVTEEVEIEVKSTGSKPNARDRSVFVDPVLNPVENLTQWKAVKGKRTPILRPEKENCNSNQEFRSPFSKELSFKELPFSLKSESEQSRKLSQEISVDASLSNWLSSSETTPVNKAASPTAASYLSTPEWSNSQSSRSGISHEDRPILGALTVEELRQFSASCSPRKSPSRSPDEMPIIGTVGTYWNHTDSAKDSGSASSFKGIPNTTSKYREDKKVNWHSTPFETRLERALNRCTADEASTDVFLV